MNPLNKCKMFAWGIFGIVSILEVFLFCRLFDTGFENWILMTFIVAFVAVFNGSIWWFRNMYDKAIAHYDKENRPD